MEAASKENVPRVLLGKEIFKYQTRGTDDGTTAWRDSRTRLAVLADHRKSYQDNQLN